MTVTVGMLIAELEQCSPDLPVFVQLGREGIGLDCLCVYDGKLVAIMPQWEGAVVTGLAPRSTKQADA